MFGWREQDPAEQKKWEELIQWYYENNDYFFDSVVLSNWEDPNPEIFRIEK